MVATTHRIQVTETPELAGALRTARRRWPGEKRTSRLIEKLAVEGAQRLDVERETPDQRKARIREIAARNDTRFPDNYLQTVREGWQ